jgi:hypothetical protein
MNPKLVLMAIAVVAAAATFAITSIASIDVFSIRAGQHDDGWQYDRRQYDGSAYALDRNTLYFF